MPDVAPRRAMPDPVLSVVVTIVGGRAFLEEFLEAILSQQDGPELEVIVPFDASVDECGALAPRYPRVRFLDLGAIETERARDTAAGVHELYDRRRAAGLAAASGALIAILEDRGIPRPDWAKTARELHRQPAKVIGGAIEYHPSGLLNWACHICDYGRYSLPFEAGEAAWVSDVNVTYKREAIDATRHLWAERFQEPVVHWALASLGETLLLCPQLVVDHRRSRTSLGELVRERFHWGRLFGQIRAKSQTRAQRAVYALGAPFVPLVLLWRHARMMAEKKQMKGFLAALPLLPVLLGAWTTGELWGTVTRRA